MKLAYVPKKKLTEFRNEMIKDFLNKDKKGIKNRLNAFETYGLKWFQDHSPRIQDWVSLEKRWGRALINLEDIPKKDRIFEKGELRSKNTIIRVIWMMNHFLEFIHKEYPHKFPHFKLNPVKKQHFGKLKEAREDRKLTRQRVKIDDISWEKIKKSLYQEDNIDLRILILCREFGLRRNEALMLKNSSMKKHSLFITCLLYTSPSPRD